MPAATDQVSVVIGPSVLRAIDRDQVNCVADPRGQAEQVACKVTGGQFVRSPEQQGGSCDRHQQRGGLTPARRVSRDEEAVEREQDGGDVAEQGGIGEPRPQDTGMPQTQVGREEQPGHHRSADQRGTTRRRSAGLSP
jgi:hypothetical protein